ncbi:uncharacterized protein SPPG_00685 [Spizellomyces punctatus DAOM BR117]|uniref:Cadherin domain-containing protein n=1 Tax=Spizellomyces punctatus (strain DAOM BR117) TaxID=645134 RepID=A0A0L0HVU9_SPIPD|nr:uncharacterized protein SPPG_00685 [Spizellomyces punctatus DAOM BR117]KND05004.1 hypothetical protein SPPG_00685 [Spizellomyces punctatus DAOM BR117]|eukprot:XP_016613043.1 hypothetical protein SPPG_00685 [Spizellomyces punctatus DAOM BR117]
MITPAMVQYVSKVVPDALWEEADWWGFDSSFGGLQLKINGTWTNIGPGGKFYQSDIDSGRVRYMALSPSSRWTNCNYYIRDGTPYEFIGGLSVEFNFPPTVSPITTASTSANVAVQLQSVNLNAADTDDDATRLVYSIQAYSNAGTLTKMATPGSVPKVLPVNSTFTVDDVRNGMIWYQPIATNGTAEVNLTVADSQPGYIPTILRITILPMTWTNQTYTTTWLQGAAWRTVAPAHIMNPAPTMAVDSVIYTIVSITDGMFLRVLDTSGWKNVGVGGNFSLAQVAYNQVQVNTSATFTGTATLNYTATAPGASSAFGSYSVYVNYPPIITTKSGVVVPQNSKPLDMKTILGGTDVENNAWGLQFTVTQWPGNGAGLYRYITYLGPANYYNGPYYFVSFSQNDLNSGYVQLRFNPSSYGMTTFAFTLSDGSYSVPSGPVSVYQFPAPVIKSISPTVAQNGSLVISDSSLMATSVEPSVTPSSLLFTIIAPAFPGNLTNASSLDQQMLTNFTALDISNRQLQYTPPTGWNGTAVISFTVSDGVNLLSSKFSIIVNSLPWISVNITAFCPRNGSVPLRGLLQYSDINNLPTSIVYSLSSGPLLDFGCVQARTSATAPWSCATTWTQDDIDKGNVQYMVSSTNLGSERIAFSVSDPYNILPAVQYYNVTIIPAWPVLVSNRVVLSAAVNGMPTVTFPIQTEHLQYTCADTPPDQMKYTLLKNTNVSMAYQLELFNGTNWTVLPVPGGTWFQSDIDSGNLRVTATASKAGTEVVQLIVQSSATTSNGTLRIQYHYMPVIVSQTTMWTYWWNSKSIGSTNLKALAPDQPDATKIVYKITRGPLRGTLSSSQFSQDDINRNLVTYRHTGWVNQEIAKSDDFGFLVYDAVGLPSAGNATVLLVNQLPVKGAATTLFAYPTSGNRTVTTNMLTWTDVDGPNQLTFVLLSNLTFGSLMVKGRRLSVGDMWNASNIGVDLMMVDMPLTSLTNMSVSFDYNVTDGINVVQDRFNVNFVPPPQYRGALSPLCDADSYSRRRCNILSTFNVWTTLPASSIIWTFPKINSAECYSNWLTLDYSYGYIWPTSNVGGPYSFSLQDMSTGFAVDCIYGVPGWLRFTATFTDGLNPPVSQMITIQWNYMPRLQTNVALQLAVLAQPTVVNITSGYLNWQDSDNATTQLMYTLSSEPAKARLSLLVNGTVTNLSSGSRWTQDDINSNRLVFNTNYTDRAGARDAFTYNFTDGIWNFTEQTVSIVYEDAPRMTANQTMFIDWTGRTTSQRVVVPKSSLEWVSNFEAPSSLMYTILSSPQIGSLQLWVDYYTRVPLYNATYCTCSPSQTPCPPVQPCQYTFTQNDIANSNLEFYATASSNLSSNCFRYNISTGGFRTEADQWFCTFVYTPPKISKTLPVIAWGSSITLNASWFSVTTAEPILAPWNLTYTVLSLPTVDNDGNLQVTSGVQNQSTVTIGSTWTQKAVADGMLVFTHAPTSTNATVSPKYTFGTNLWDGLTNSSLSLEVLVAVPPRLNSNFIIVLPKGGSKWIYVTSLPVLSDRLLTYSIISIPVDMTVSFYDSYWWTITTVSAGFTFVAGSGNQVKIAARQNITGGDYNITMVATDGANPPINFNVPVHIHLPLQWLGTRVLLVPQNGGAFLNTGIISAVQPDVDILTKNYGTSSISYSAVNYASITKFGGLYDAYNYPWNSWSWRADDMQAKDVRFNAAKGVVGKTQLNVSCYDGWQTVYTALDVYIVAKPTVTVQPLTTVIDSPAKTLASNLNVTIDNFMAAQNLSYTVNLTVISGPSLGSLWLNVQSPLTASTSGLSGSVGGVSTSGTVVGTVSSSVLVGTSTPASSLEATNSSTSGTVVGAAASSSVPLGTVTPTTSLGATNSITSASTSAIAINVSTTESNSTTGTNPNNAPSTTTATTMQVSSTTTSASLNETPTATSTLSPTTTTSSIMVQAGSVISVNDLMLGRLVYLAGRTAGTTNIIVQVSDGVSADYNTTLPIYVEGYPISVGTGRVLLAPKALASNYTTTIDAMQLRYQTITPGLKIMYALEDVAAPVNVSLVLMANGKKVDIGTGFGQSDVDAGKVSIQWNGNISASQNATIGLIVSNGVLNGTMSLLVQFNASLIPFPVFSTTKSSSVSIATSSLSSARSSVSNSSVSVVPTGTVSNISSTVTSGYSSSLTNSTSIVLSSTSSSSTSKSSSSSSSSIASSTLLSSSSSLLSSETSLTTTSLQSSASPSSLQSSASPSTVQSSTPASSSTDESISVPPSSSQQSSSPPSVPVSRTLSSSLETGVESSSGLASSLSGSDVVSRTSEGFITGGTSVGVTSTGGTSTRGTPTDGPIKMTSNPDLIATSSMTGNEMTTSTDTISGTPQPADPAPNLTDPNTTNKAFLSPTATKAIIGSAAGVVAIIAGAGLVFWYRRPPQREFERRRTMAVAGPSAMNLMQSQQSMVSVGKSASVVALDTKSASVVALDKGGGGMGGSSSQLLGS